jgi:hypothetical protein
MMITGRGRHGTLLGAGAGLCASARAQTAAIIASELSEAASGLTPLSYRTHAPIQRAVVDKGRDGPLH